MVRDNLVYARQKLKKDLNIDINHTPVIISEDSTSLRVFLDTIVGQIPEAVTHNGGDVH